VAAFAIPTRKCKPGPQLVGTRTLMLFPAAPMAFISSVSRCACTFFPLAEAGRDARSDLHVTFVYTVCTMVEPPDNGVPRRRNQKMSSQWHLSERFCTRWGGDRPTSRRGRWARVERRRHAMIHALKQGPGLKRLVSFILLSYKRAFLLLEQRNESYAVPAKTARGPVDGDADRIT
jgi:hypothetical protein